MREGRRILREFYKGIIGIYEIGNTIQDSLLQVKKYT